MAKQDATQIIKKPQKMTPATIPDGAPGDNAKYTAFAIAIAGLPKIDVNNPVQLSQRLTDYFQLCVDHDMKPAVAAMALAFGLDRRRLWEINNDVAGRNTSMPQECREIIKTAYTSLEVLWESYSLSGKINPVTAIFLGKNNFGYQDKQEYVVTPNAMSQDTPVDVIEAKYDALPED
jgi:hypothetical protein